MMNASDINNKFLDSMRLTGDTPADTFVSQIFDDLPQKKNLLIALNQLQGNSLSGFAQTYPSDSFIQTASDLPAWADERQMREGSAFFVKYAEQIMQLLGLLSLPYCYAAADGARVLHLSQRLKNDCGKRLHDTAEFIWQVMAPDAFSKTGSGFAACLKIRITHAAARFYTLASGDWNPAWGFPVNQEDMAGTNLSFSLIVIRGLRKLGYAISYQEQQSFIHLWNVIGCLLGLSEKLMPADGKLASALEKLIALRQFRPSDNGQSLLQSLLDYFEQTSAVSISKLQTQSLMRFLLGNEVSDILGITQDTLPGYLPLFMRVSGAVNRIGNFHLNVAYKEKYNAYRKTLKSGS